MTNEERPINLVSAGAPVPEPAGAGDDQPDLSAAAIDILRFTEKMTLGMGLTLLLAPLGLWLALVVPRVQEITGAAAASGQNAKDGFLVGIMLAVISVAVSLVATIIRAYAHSEVDERIELEREAVEQARPDGFRAACRGRRRRNAQPRVRRD